MITFVYSHYRKPNDTNGNPRQWFSVWRVKNNIPCALKLNEFFSYKSTHQAVSDWLYENKYLPRKAKIHRKNGFNGIDWTLLQKTHQLLEF